MRCRLVRGSITCTHGTWSGNFCPIWRSVLSGECPLREGPLLYTFVIILKVTMVANADINTDRQTYPSSHALTLFIKWLLQVSATLCLICGILHSVCMYSRTPRSWDWWMLPQTNIPTWWQRLWTCKVLHVIGDGIHAFPSGLIPGEIWSSELYLRNHICIVIYGLHNVSYVLSFSAVMLVIWDAFFLWDRHKYQYSENFLRDRCHDRPPVLKDH